MIRSDSKILKSVSILSTRGIPARHGGFETFAEHLALYLAAKGWRVTVYCQVDGDGPVTTDTLILTLGYNAAVFCVLYRLKGLYNLINMDGIEWKREKWSLPERMWIVAMWKAARLRAKERFSEKTHMEKLLMLLHA